MQKKLIDIIHKQVSLNEEKSKHKHSIKFYPSSIGFCSRAIVYRMLNYPASPLDPRILSIMDNGTQVHTRLENIFQKTNLMIAAELMIKDESLNISGRSDVIIKSPYETIPNNKIIKLYNIDKELVYEGSSNMIHLIEIKSINDNGFKRILNKADTKHKDQLTLYMNILKIPNGSLLYENKNTQQLAEHIIKYNETDGDRVINQVKYCNKHAMNKTLPPREYEAHSFECRYCDYANICRPNNSKSTSQHLDFIINKI